MAYYLNQAQHDRLLSLRGIHCPANDGREALSPCGVCGQDWPCHTEELLREMLGWPVIPRWAP